MKVYFAVTHIFETVVAWGDCDEAVVVFYPNYFYCMDSAFQAFLRISASARESSGPGTMS